MNKFIFTGNLGRDAETKIVGGTTVCNFAVAVTSGYGDKQKTTWVSCALWGKQAEGALPGYLVKGQKVAVCGELSTREYQANDGTTKTVVEVRCDNVDLIGAKSDTPVTAPAAPAAPAARPAPQQAAAAQNYDDSIPF